MCVIACEAGRDDGASKGAWDQETCTFGMRKMRQVRSYLGRLGARSQLYAGDDKVTEFGIALVVLDTPSSAICGGLLGLHYGFTVCCSGGRDSGVTLAATSSVSSRKCTLKTSVGSEITN